MELAKLPNREGLLSMLLSVLQAPMRNMACVVKAVSEQKEAGRKWIHPLPTWQDALARYLKEIKF